MLSEAQAQKMIKVLAAGTLLPVPGAEHAPSLVEPEAVAGLDGFLGR